MSRVVHMPTSLKVKVAWLVAAFVVVWMNAPVDAGRSGDEGRSLGTPTAAVASTLSTDVLALESPPPGVTGPTGPGLRVRLARGETTQAHGARVGVLATIDELVPAGLARQPGERQVWVYVALKNVGADEIAYTALDIEITDGRSLFSSVEGRRGPGPMLRFGTLARGEATAGWRVFRVPADAGPFHLLYSGGAAG